MASSTLRNRRLSSADGRGRAGAASCPITSANYGSASIERSRRKPHPRPSAGTSPQVGKSCSRPPAHELGGISRSAPSPGSAGYFPMNGEELRFKFSPIPRLRRVLPHEWGRLKKTRRRLQRTPPRPGRPPGDTLMVYSSRFTAVASFGRPTFALTVGGPGRRTNCLQPATNRRQCQGGKCT